MSSGFRQRLLAGDLLVGTIVSLGTPDIADLLARAGFDWLFLDTEHSPLEAAAAQRLVQAAAPCPCVVRVAALDEVSIKKALDIGAAGVIVPQVNSAADARRAVDWCKYPPVGTRGVGVARAHGYGLEFADYVARANDESVVIVQAEHVDAVDNIETIAAVEGIDAVFIGPYDLSASMGLMGEVGDARVTGAIERVRQGATAAGKRLGMFGLDAPALEAYVQQGYSLIAVGIDALTLGQAARAMLAEVRAGARLSS